MKKLITMVLTLCMLLTCIMAFASCTQEDSKTLHVYTHSGFAPYEYVDENNNVVGVDMDTIKYIGEKLGYKVVINDIEFNQILTEVEKDKMAVGVAGMSKKPARDEVALASEVYATSIQYVIAPKGTFESGKVVPIADVVEYVKTQSAKSIGAQAGTTGKDMVDNAVKDTGATLIEYKNAILASQDIGKTVSAVVIDKMPAQSISGSNADLECWQLEGELESYVMYLNKYLLQLLCLQ